MGSYGLKMTNELDLKEVTYIHPSPAMTGQGVTWSRYANIGGAAIFSNTDNSQFSADAEGIARTKQNRFTVGAYVNRAKADDENIAFNSKGYMQYDHFINKSWYGYTNGSVENDQCRDIDLRSSTGIGSGDQIDE
jgi:hypothetical protein